MVEPTEIEIQKVLNIFSTGAPKELEREYFIDVLRCAGNSLNKELSNSDIKHAAFLMKLLFERAKEIVRIHTGSLFNGVYGISQVISAARAFGEREGKIFIAYSNLEKFEDIQKNSIFLNDLHDLIKSGKIKMWNASEINKISNINHFAVQDNGAYRIELDMIDRKASANFGDIDSAKTLSKSFDLIIAKATPVLNF
jgi:hypothetical protein